MTSRSAFAPLVFPRYRCQVKAVWRILALTLVFSLVPGAAEAVENVTHLVREGHLAHDADASSRDDEHHDGEEGEHGCNSVFHVCSCHVSASFIVNERGAMVLKKAPVLSGTPWYAYEDARADGFSHALLRPPIA